MSIYRTVGNFRRLIFHGLESSDDFVGLYFCGVPPLTVKSLSYIAKI